MFSTATAALLVSSLLSPLLAGEEKPTLESLSWLTGSWGSTMGGVTTEETWTTPKGGLMLGTNRTVKAKARSSFEFLRIAETEKGLSYFASPSGKPAHEFPLKSIEKEKVTFEDAGHDFPQRIIYWMNDSKLHARIEGMVGGKERSMEWVWENSAK